MVRLLIGTLLEALSPSTPLTPLDRLQVTLWMPSEFREVHPSDFEGSHSEKSDGSWKVPNVSSWKHAGMDIGKIHRVYLEKNPQIEAGEGQFLKTYV